MEVCRKLGNIKLENRPYTEVPPIVFLWITGFVYRWPLAIIGM
jgi:hypothetical protein